MAQLEGMGFPTVRCQKALLATGNADAEAAMEWLFAHMDDPDIDAPIAVGGAGAGGGGGEPAAEQVAMLADMGFSEKQARKALKETVSVDFLSLVLSRCLDLCPDIWEGEASALIARAQRGSQRCSGLRPQA